MSVLRVGDVFLVVFLDHLVGSAELLGHLLRIHPYFEHLGDVGMAGIAKRPWPDAQSSPGRGPVTLLKIVFANSFTVDRGKEGAVGIKLIL